MKKVWMVVSLGSVFAMAGMAETWSGTISDSMCGAKHAAAAAADTACVKKCIKGGASAVLVSEGKVYQLSEDSQQKVANLLGEKVTVNGKLEGETITVESATAAK